jgi:hypothetical protein
LIHQGKVINKEPRHQHHVTGEDFMELHRFHSLRKAITVTNVMIDASFPVRESSTIALVLNLVEVDNRQIFYLWKSPHFQDLCAYSLDPSFPSLQSGNHHNIDKTHST